MASDKHRIQEVYNKYPANVVEQAKKWGLITPEMKPSQVNQVLLGLHNKLIVNHVKTYANADYDYKMMEVVRILLENSIHKKVIRRVIEHEDFDYREVFVYVYAWHLIGGNNNEKDDRLIRRYMMKDPEGVVKLYEKFLPIVKKEGFNRYTFLLFDKDFYCAQINFLLDHPEVKRI